MTAAPKDCRPGGRRTHVAVAGRSFSGVATVTSRAASWLALRSSARSFALFAVESGRARRAVNHIRPWPAAKQGSSPGHGPALCGPAYGELQGWTDTLNAHMPESLARMSRLSDSAATLVAPCPSACPRSSAPKQPGRLVSRCWWSKIDNAGVNTGRSGRSVRWSVS